MDEPEFGFQCGDFSGALSGNDVIVPGSKNAPLRKGDYILDIPARMVYIL